MSTHNSNNTESLSAAEPISPAAFDIEALSPREQRVVLVCDVVESVRWMEHDEDNAITRWSQFAAAVRSSIAPNHAGRVVKSTGDGLMLEFESAPQAVAAANAMQKLSAEGNAGFDAERQMHLRVGIHQAQVRRDAHDLYGHGVNLAARIATLAKPGEIVVSAYVRDRTVDSGVDNFEDLGSCFLKHVQQPVRAFKLDAAGSPLAAAFESRYTPSLLPIVAVIPLWPVAQSKGIDTAIGDAIADDVISSISKTKRLHVVSRLSTAKFSASTVDTVQVQQTLSAHYIVSGTYSLLGEKVVVRVQLCSTADQRVLWSDTLRANWRDIFYGQDSIVPAIAANIGSCIINHEMSRTRLLPLTSLESYSLYLSSISMLHRSSFSEFSMAQEMLEQLRHRHPKQSAPHATLAKWHLTSILQGWSAKPEQDRLIARQLARTALQCDPENAFAKATDGFLAAHFTSDLDLAAKVCEESLEMDPQEPQVWRMLSTIHSYQGNGQQALACANKAMALSPVDPAAYLYELICGVASLANHDYEHAIDCAKKSLRRNITHVPTHRLKVIALCLSGEVAKAKTAAHELLQHSPQFRVNTFKESYPGRNKPHATAYHDALLEAGLPA